MDQNELIKKQKEISNLQSTIDDLNKKLQDSESLKSNFISNIMNEVYNPFTSIMSMSDNIITLNDSNLGNAIPMAKIIYREAAQLDFHLQNIFEAAKIEAGLETLEVSSVSIEDIQQTVLNKFQFDLKNKNISIISNITKKDTTYINTDPSKLTLILLNLISNSIKYSHENGEITINFELIEGIINMEVSDNGIGISSDKIKMIFDRFKRVDTTINSVTGGTGLGLSVVKALIEILDGNISIVSSKGTKVLISIPNQHDPGISFENDTILFDEEVF